MKRTYQPKKLKRIRKFGFRSRMSDSDGKNVLKRRRAKGRKQLSATEEMVLKRKKPKAKFR